jgi:hypothetical protein
MIYRRREGEVYRNGLNWTWVKLNAYWWFAIVLVIGPIHLGFRYRSVLTPHFINYSEIRRG